MASPADPGGLFRSGPSGHGFAAYALFVEFRVLGPVEVFVDGRPVSLGGPKQRHVLALLVAGLGGPVSVDRLVDGVWGERAPAGARGTLQTYVSNLRGQVGEVILFEAAGYRLAVDRESVDAFRFEDLVASARRQADPVAAASQLRVGLGLWRGRPFADVEDVGGLNAVMAQLEELRVVALEARVEADLACGLHVDLVGELERLAAEHPFRERFRAQHMLALYRSGRQAEALRAFQKTRILLADELGIDPSPMLQELEQRILSHDASLELEPRVESRAFLFTDLEDSTLLWELHPEVMGGSLLRHDEIVRGAVAAFGGRVFRSTGNGFCAVFVSVPLAVAAAEHAQKELAAVIWDATGPLHVRMAIDLGEVETRGADFLGPPLNRCSRILASGHGGQVLISADAQQALSDDATGMWQVKALGEYRFKEQGRTQPVYQLVGGGDETERLTKRAARRRGLLVGFAGTAIVALGVAALALAGPDETSCVEPPEGLTGWWPGDRNGADIVGGRNASLIGDASLAEGLVGNAFLLDGDGDFVEVAHDPALNLGRGDFTVDLWVNFKDPTGEQILVEKYIERFGPESTGWTFSKGDDGVFISGSDGLPVTVPANQWVHFAARRSGTEISIFMNGARIGFVDLGESYNFDTTSSIKFGHRGSPGDTVGSLDDSGFFANGRIDEVDLVVGSALSDDQIRAIYLAGSAGKCK